MSRDLRHYARQTNIRIAIGAILVLFVVGDGLIYLIYGRGAAVLGFFCLMLGLGPIVLVWLALALIDWVVKRADRE